MPKTRERASAASTPARAIRARMWAEDEEARRAWARTLHRDVSSGLSGVLLQLGALHGARVGTARAILERAQAALEASIRAARDVELALRPPLIEEAGLGPPLRWLVARAAASGPIEVNLPLTLPRLGVALEGLIFGAVDLLLSRALRGSRRLDVVATDGALTLQLAGTPTRDFAFALATARDRLNGRARVVARTGPRPVLIVRVPRAGSHRRPRI